MKKVFLMLFISFCFGFTGLVLWAGSANAQPPYPVVGYDNPATWDEDDDDDDDDDDEDDDDLDECEAAVQILPGDGAGDGPALDYQDNSDGTFTDCNTKDQWGKKLKADGSEGGDCNLAPAMRSVHCVNNNYSWSKCDGPPADPCPPNGTMFTEFLAEVNASALGGFSDWCIPNLKRLEMIVDSGTCNGCNGGTAASSVPGETAIFNPFYWSATRDAGGPIDVWIVDFGDGGVRFFGLEGNAHARAVRPCP